MYINNHLPRWTFRFNHNWENWVEFISDVTRSSCFSGFFYHHPIFISVESYTNTMFRGEQIFRVILARKYCWLDFIGFQMHCFTWKGNGDKACPSDRNLLSSSKVAA